MKQKYSEAIEKGEIVKFQRFETEKGTYCITLIRYNDHIYFLKQRNGKVLECADLNEKKTEVKKHYE